jgi:hypothetical protein
MHIQRRSLLTDYLKIEALLTLRCLRALIFLKSAKNVLKELALQSANRVFRSKMENLFVFPYVWNTGALLK